MVKRTQVKEKFLERVRVVEIPEYVFQELLLTALSKGEPIQ
jgi:predicted HTH transcriptional regulator